MRRRKRGYLRTPWDVVFRVGAHIVVLRALDRISLGGTGREVARVAGLAPQAAHDALARLEEVGVVLRRPAGRAYVFQLNVDHILVRDGIRPLLRLEERFGEWLKSELKKAIPDKKAVGVIFGSMARGEESPGSDCDVCVVVAREREKEKIGLALGRIFEGIRNRFGLNLSPLVLSRREFVAGFRRRNPLYRAVVREGERFCGPSWSEVIRGAEDVEKAR